MSTQFNVAEAKARLSDLLVRAEKGEDVTIARAGQPVARIVAIKAPERRVFPSYAEYDIPDEILLAPMSEDTLLTPAGYRAAARRSSTRSLGWQT